jgi:outer membrane protein W
MRTSGPVVAAVISLSIFVFASDSLAAEKGDQRVQFGLLYMVPTDDLVEPGETLELDESFGLQVSFERMVTDRIGVEPTIWSTSHDVEVSDAMVPDFDLGEIDLFAVAVNVNYRVLERDRVELFVGPTVGYAFWGDLETGLGDFSADDEFVYGVNLGLDVPVGGGKWGVSGALGYLFSEIGLEGSGSDLGVDPFQLKLGLSYRF